jgi:iron complex transport system substrate-binding protein
VQTLWNRRAFFGVAGAAGILVAAACSSDKPANGTADGGAVTIDHAFGQTVVPAPPKRVVSVGFTEQDDLLALGVVPVAVTNWFGDQPFAVWPWAQSALGSGQPVVLTLNDGIAMDQIATLKPDLIVATNAGVDQDTYDKLSAIAPTLPQSGPAPYFEPWKDQATAIGKAVFQADKMASLIAGIDEKFTSIGTNNAQFKGKSALLLQGNTYWENSIIAGMTSWKTEFLSQLGFVTPDDAIASFRQGDDRTYIPPEKAAAVLGDVDVLIWKTESDAEIAALRADPGIAALLAKRERGSIFTTKDLAGAIAFASPLSYPVVADQLTPLLVKAIG